jgi:hypothetical protein
LMYTDVFTGGQLQYAVLNAGFYAIGFEYEQREVGCVYSCGDAIGGDGFLRMRALCVDFRSMPFLCVFPRRRRD